MDWVGALLVTAGLVFIVFFLSDGSIAPNGWRTGCTCDSFSVYSIRYLISGAFAHIVSLDIIALFIIGISFLVLFVFWERYLERVHVQGGEACQKWWTPPPLMTMSIWGRANGKVAAVLVIAFVEWCSFNGFTFWVQVGFSKSYSLHVPSIITTLTCFLAVLPGISPSEPYPDDDSAAPHASNRHKLQCGHRSHSLTRQPRVPRRYVSPFMIANTYSSNC